MDWFERNQKLHIYVKYYLKGTLPNKNQNAKCKQKYHNVSPRAYAKILRIVPYLFRTNEHYGSRR
jgi:hypothetical protein